MDINNDSAVIEHEATTSKINEDQIFYCNQRGISTEDAIGLIVNGYAKEVMNKLPMEFAVEAQKLLQISLEGSVGYMRKMVYGPMKGITLPSGSVPNTHQKNFILRMQKNWLR